MLIVSQQSQDIKPPLPKGIDYVAMLKGHLRLAADGTWWHEGRCFQNKHLADLFSRSIVWDQQLQSYFIQLGRQRASFDLDDTAYFVLSVDDSNNPWMLTLSNGNQEILNPSTLKAAKAGQLYCLVHASAVLDAQNEKKHRARFSRAAHQTVLSHAIDEFSIDISGSRVIVEIEA